MNWFQGLSRPMRLAGVVLIGIAVVAAVVGTTVALSGGSGQNASPPPSAAPSSSAPAPPSSAPVSPAPPPSSSAAPPPGSSVPGQPPGASPGQPPAGVPGQPGGEQAATKWVTVRVYNNSMIHGLATRAADDLRRQGWNVAEVTNYPFGVIPTTTAYFRPGTDEEAAAQDLAITFGMKAEPRFDGIQAASPGLIVIVTNDYKGPSGKTG